MTAESLDEIEQKLGHRFADRDLLAQALTHSSSTVASLTDNERMEFLGDAVLSLVMSEALFIELPDRDEGDLTSIKSVAVSTLSLARCGRQLELERHAFLGRGIAPQMVSASMYANFVEALFAAVYLDAGIDTAREVVLRVLDEQIQAAIEGEQDKNYKSLLQQHVQRKLGQAPLYRVVCESGPDHGKTFLVSAVIGDVSYPPGEGRSKKQAEQRAAARALESLGVEV